MAGNIEVFIENTTLNLKGISFERLEIDGEGRIKIIADRIDGNIDINRAKDVFLIREPIAAAIGAGIDITKACGSMIVDIGGGTTDIAVISLCEPVVDFSLKVAGDKFEDEMDMLTEERNKYLDERDKRRKDGTFLIEEVYYHAKVRAVQKEIDEVYDSRSVVDEQLNETVEEISKLSAEAEHSIKLIEKHLRTLVKIESDRDPSQKTIGGPEDK